jgi:hypothetical protein
MGKQHYGSATVPIFPPKPSQYQALAAAAFGAWLNDGQPAIQGFETKL